MAKMTLDDLKKRREETKVAMDMRDTSNKEIQIIVGMGTSGIAAGAKEVLNTFVTILTEKKLSNVKIRQTGSIGLDHAEPVVEVHMPGMPNIIYGRVNPDIAKKIVTEHIMNKKLLDEHVFDRPAVDIVKD